MSNGAPPALWEHATRTFDAMKTIATKEPVSVSDTEQVEAFVYEGFLSRLMFEELGIPVPAYGKVLGVLKDMGCISQLRRGGGSSPSRWVLWKDPDLELFYQVTDAVSATRTQYHRELDVIRSQMADIRGALGGINVPSAVRDLAEHLSKLDQRVSELEKTK